MKHMIFLPDKINPPESCQIAGQIVADYDKTFGKIVSYFSSYDGILIDTEYGMSGIITCDGWMDLLVNIELGINRVKMKDIETKIELGNF